MTQTGAIQGTIGVEDFTPEALDHQREAGSAWRDGRSRERVRVDGCDADLFEPGAHVSLASRDAARQRHATNPSAHERTGRNVD